MSEGLQGDANEQRKAGDKDGTADAEERPATPQGAATRSGPRLEAHS